MLPDVKWSKGVDWSIFSEVESNIEYNENLPFWLYFTPNGNFWTKQQVWKKIIRKSSEAEKYISCLFFDIDIKSTDFQSVDEAFDYVIKTLSERRLKANYLCKSGGGIHWYLFIEPSQRHNVWERYYRKFPGIMKAIAEMFQGWDQAIWQLERLMRVPFSNHWKTGEPIQVTLYKLNWEWPTPEVEEVTKPDQIELPEYTLLNQDQIASFAESVSEEIDIKKELGNTLTLSQSSIIDQVNKIPIQHIITALAKYPRISPDEKTSTKFYYHKTHIYFEHTNLETWEVTHETTMGYRIWEDRNCLNNFSAEHNSLIERPRWEPYSVIYYYFEKDLPQVYEFIKTEFKLQFEEEQSEYTMPTIIAPNGSIQFTKAKVLYQKQVIDSKGKMQQQVKVLFDSPIRIKWWAETKFSLFWELEKPKRIYIIEKLDNLIDKEYVIEFCESKFSFNKKYWSNWLIFKSSEDDLLDFYVGINHAVTAGQIKKYEYITQNGMYDKYFILWDTFITPDFTIIDKPDDVILNNPSIRVHLKDKRQIPATEYFDFLKTITSDRVATLGFLTYAALFLGDFFWDPIRNIKQQFMIPWMFVSWATHSGKSTLLLALKEGSGIDKEACKKSISATQQPLKQMATDWFIAHYDEFTAENGTPDKENMLRDIVNKSISARGTITGENITYKYKASLLVDWEKLPSSTSVLNRMIVVAMYEEDKKGTEEALAELNRISFAKDLITRAYRIMDSKQKIQLFTTAEDVLRKNWLSWRSLLLNTYLLFMAYMLDIKDIQWIVKIIVENDQLMRWASSFGDDIDVLLSEAIIKSRFVPIARVQFSTNYKEITIPISKEFLNSKFIYLTSAKKKYPNVFFTDDSSILLKVFPNDATMSAKIEKYEQYFRYGDSIPEPVWRPYLSNNIPNATPSNNQWSSRNYSSYEGAPWNH